MASFNMANSSSSASHFGPVPVEEIKLMVQRGMTYEERVLVKSRGRPTPDIALVNEYYKNGLFSHF